jgi:hypothetical protein
MSFSRKQNNRKNYGSLNFLHTGKYKIGRQRFLIKIVAGKGKVHPRTCHEGPEGE